MRLITLKSSLLGYYNNECKHIIDRHAHLPNRTGSLRNPTSWYSEDIKPEKKDVDLKENGDEHDSKLTMTALNQRRIE